MTREEVNMDRPKRTKKQEQVQDEINEYYTGAPVSWKKESKEALIMLAILFGLLLVGLFYLLLTQPR